MWTRASMLVLVGACYAPTLTTGAPCDPVIDNCPSGQTCELRGADYRCGGPGEVTTDGPAGDAALIDAPPLDVAIDGPIDAPGPGHVEYVAVVADCVNPMVPNPDACKTSNGATELAVDLADTTTNAPWVSYLRFDLDGVLAGRTVTSVKLRTVATDDPTANSPNSGQVWRVGAFARTDLFATPLPGRIGAAPLAGTQGAVTQLQAITWTLPIGLATASGHVYLELSSTSSDGVNYWNLGGANPPRLVVDYQ